VGEKLLEQPEEAQDHNGQCRELQDGHGAHRGTRRARTHERPATGDKEIHPMRRRDLRGAGDKEIATRSGWALPFSWSRPMLAPVGTAGVPG
jgi:hypothetical protein